MCAQQTCSQISFSLSSWTNCNHRYPERAEWRFWSDRADAQADLNLCRAHMGPHVQRPRSLISSSLSSWRNLHPNISQTRRVKILIRFRGCAVWSESLLSAHGPTCPKERGFFYYYFADLLFFFFFFFFFFWSPKIRFLTLRLILNYKISIEEADWMFCWSSEMTRLASFFHKPSHTTTVKSQACIMIRNLKIRH